MTVSWRRLQSAFLVTSLMAAGLGCAGIQDLFRDPELDLQRVVVRSVGLTGGTLDLVVQMYNPNQFALRGTELRLGFDVQDAHVGDVVYRNEFTVQQGDTTVMTLPLRFEWAGVGSALRTALQSREIPYTMRGEVRVDTPIGIRTVPFTRTGRVPVSQLAGGAVVPTGGR